MTVQGPVKKQHPDGMSHIGIQSSVLWPLCVRVHMWAGCVRKAEKRTVQESLLADLGLSMQLKVAAVSDEGVLNRVGWSKV